MRIASGAPIPPLRVFQSLTVKAIREVQVTIGGTVIIYSGIFSICHDEAALASMLAHGLSSAIAEDRLETAATQTSLRGGLLPLLPYLVQTLTLKGL